MLLAKKKHRCKKFPFEGVLPFLVVFLWLFLCVAIRLLFAIFGLSVDDTVRFFAVLVFFPFLLFRVLFFLLLPVLDLVFDQIVEGCDGSYQTAEVDRHELIVGLDAHRACEFGVLGLVGFGAVGLGGRGWV